MALNSPYIQVKWQEGSFKEGVNGASISDVLKVVLEETENRLNDKKTNNRDLALARNKVEEAIMWLNRRKVM